MAHYSSDDEDYPCWSDYDLYDAGDGANSDDDQHGNDPYDWDSYYSEGETMEAYNISLRVQKSANAALQAAKKARNLVQASKEFLASGATASSSSSAATKSSSKAVEAEAAIDEKFKPLLKKCIQASKHAKSVADGLSKEVQETPLELDYQLVDKANRAESIVDGAAARALQALSEIEAAINQK